MNGPSLKSYQVIEASFVNRLENGTRIELEHKFSYNVNYAPNNICRGTLTVTVNDKNDAERFSVKVVLVGVFAFEEGAVKEKLHVETFRELFPYVRMYVSMLTSNAGISPIILPTIDISSQSIYKIERNQ